MQGNVQSNGFTDGGNIPPECFFWRVSPVKAPYTHSPHFSNINAIKGISHVLTIGSHLHNYAPAPIPLPHKTLFDSLIIRTGSNCIFTVSYFISL